VRYCIIGCGPLVLRFAIGASSHSAEDVLARRRRAAAGRAEPGRPFTLSVLPSANSTLSKKHM
jgi:hypothetical protein